MTLLLCYDIYSDRRRSRIARFLEKWGMRIQKSVFQCDLSPELFCRIRKVLKKYMSQEDRITLYPLCSSCSRPQILGMGITLEQKAWEIL